MSVQALSAVIDSGLLAGLEYRVAISIANHADATGFAWLSYERIAKEARSTKSPVIRAIKKMMAVEADERLLDMEGDRGDGPYGTNCYVLNMPRFKAAAEAQAQEEEIIRKQRRAQRQKAAQKTTPKGDQGGDHRSPASGGDLESPPVTTGHRRGDPRSPEPSITNNPPYPPSEDCPDDGAKTVAEDSAQTGHDSEGGERRRTRRGGGKVAGRGKTEKKRFKPISSMDRAMGRDLPPDPVLPAYDQTSAEGVLIDAMLAGSGRTARHAAPWINPDGSFRFKIVRHPMNGSGVRGLYFVTDNEADFRSTFTGAMKHFSIRDNALVSPAFWERARNRLKDRGEYLAEFERVGGEILTQGAAAAIRETTP